jgi:predicted outer membrane repeat protein
MSSNTGSGTIHLADSSPKLQDVIIKNNSTNGSGGAICSDGGAPELKNVLIENNRASFYGGGLFIESDMKLSDVTIKNNMALYEGGGVYISYDHNINFDQVNRCNVFLNHASVGNDFSGFNQSYVTAVYLDTMTVSVPSEKYVYGSEAFEFDIQNSALEPANQDLYVSPDGDNNNSGISADQPLKTIAYALLKIQTDSSNVRTIHLANGQYSPSLTNDVFPLFPGNYIFISGQSQQNVIINS